MQENIVGKRQQRLNVDDVDRKPPSEPEANATGYW